METESIFLRNSDQKKPFFSCQYKKYIYIGWNHPKLPGNLLSFVYLLNLNPFLFLYIYILYSMSWNRLPTLNDKVLTVLNLKLYFHSFQTLNKHYAHTPENFSLP